MYGTSAYTERCIDSFLSSLAGREHGILAVLSPAVDHVVTSETGLELSIIIPVFNELETLETLYNRLKQSLTPWESSCEILFINDGSSDGSSEELQRLAALDRRVRVLEFVRNFGQTAAIAAGFDYARGRIIIPLDADLQNDPQDIPRIMEKLEEGYDVVNCWRQDRKDPWLTRILPSHLANRLISWISGVYLRDYGCTLKGYRREIVRHIRLYGEMHRFIPIFASWAGARRNPLLALSLFAIVRVLFEGAWLWLPLLFVPILVWGLVRRHYTLALASLTLFYFASFALYLQPFEAFKPVRHFAERIKTNGGQQDFQAGYYKFAAPSLAFYLDQPIFELGDLQAAVALLESEATVYMIVSAEDYLELTQATPQPLQIVEERPKLYTTARTLIEGFRRDRSDNLRESWTRPIYLITNRGNL